jgi:hypothetical protein
MQLNYNSKPQKSRRAKHRYVVSELMKPLPEAAVRDRLSKLGETPLTTTAVTITEIEFGLRCPPDGHRKGNLNTSFGAFVSALSVLPLDE